MVTINRKDTILSCAKKHLSDVDYRELVQHVDDINFKQVVDVLYEIINEVHQQTIAAVQMGEEITLK